MRCLNFFGTAFLDEGAAACAGEVAGESVTGGAVFDLDLFEELSRDLERLRAEGCFSMDLERTREEEEPFDSV